MSKTKSLSEEMLERLTIAWREYLASTDAEAQKEFTSKTTIVGELFLEYQALHQMLAHQTVQLQEHKSRIQSQGVTLEELADAVFIMKKSSEIFEKLRKEWDKRAKFITQVLVMRFIEENIQSDSPASNVKSRLATTTPRVVQAPRLPSFSGDPEQFERLCVDYLGVPKEVVLSGAVRPHWPTVTEQITKDMEEGKPAPAGVDPTKTFSDYRVTCRAASGVDLDDAETLKKLLGAQY